uniref:Magnesium transporter n=1 Tax=Amphora coffeiformis TaxID=265554 RepID=A0A7S3L4L8_9STRA|eukprot:scaffold24543_cov195-Amphora_coffeaeformis.AAC.7
MSLPLYDNDNNGDVEENVIEAAAAAAAEEVSSSEHEPPHERPRLARSERNYSDDDDEDDDDEDLDASASVPFEITARRIEQDLPQVKLEEVWENTSSEIILNQSNNNNNNKDDDDTINNNNKDDTPPSPSYWIDVEVVATDLATALPAIRQEILQRLPLSPFMKRHLAAAKQWQMPQVLPLHDAAFIVMRIIDDGTSTGSSSSSGGSGGGAMMNSRFSGTSGGATEIRHAAALCLPHILVTLTASAVLSKFGTTNPNKRNNNNNPYGGGGGGGGGGEDRRSVHYQRRRRRRRRHYDSVAHLMMVEDGRELPEATVSGCVLLWLGAHVQRTQTLAQQLRTHTYELTELAVEDLTWNDIRTAKDTLLRLAAVVEEQNESCQAVSEGDAVTAGLTLDSSQAMMGAVRVLQHSAAATERMLTRLEKRLDDLAQAAEAVQQGRINGRLQALTILSAVFLPLTLMAGLWGMNFTDMPQLERDNAYYHALASMAAVAVALLLFFYRYGWLSSNMN